MILLDENVRRDQRLLLRRWRFHVHQLGVDVAKKGMADVEEIIPFLLRQRRPTFLTRDFDFFQRELRHAQYCLVWFDVAADELAQYARRLLRHAACNTHAKRLGCVIAVSPTGFDVWRLRASRIERVRWGRTG